MLELVTPIVNLPPTQKMINAGFNKPKPPKLIEAYRHFFGDADAEEFSAKAHGALADARATARLYFHLKREGLLPEARGGTGVADAYGEFKQREGA